MASNTDEYRAGELAARQFLAGGCIALPACPYTDPDEIMRWEHGVVDHINHNLWSNDPHRGRDWFMQGVIACYDGLPRSTRPAGADDEDARLFKSGWKYFALRDALCAARNGRGVWCPWRGGFDHARDGKPAAPKAASGLYRDCYENGYADGERARKLDDAPSAPPDADLSGTIEKHPEYAALQAAGFRITYDPDADVGCRFDWEVPGTFIYGEKWTAGYFQSAPQYYETLDEAIEGIKEQFLWQQRAAFANPMRLHLRDHYGVAVRPYEDEEWDFVEVEAPNDYSDPTGDTWEKIENAIAAAVQWARDNRGGDPEQTLAATMVAVRLPPQTVPDADLAEALTAQAGQQDAGSIIAALQARLAKVGG